MAATIYNIPIAENAAPSLTDSGRVYTGFLITAMKSGEGHSDPAASIVSEVAAQMVSDPLKFAREVYLIFRTPDPLREDELASAIKLEYRNDIAYATVTYGLIAVMDDGRILTTNDGETFVPSQFRNVDI